jgi:hypothetical protein
VTAASAFRVEGEELHLRCGACGVESRVSITPRALAAPATATGMATTADPARVVHLRPVGEDPIKLAAEAALGDPFQPPSDRCPKCVAPRPLDKPSCPQCGLVFANFVPEEQGVSEWLKDAWRALLLKWGEGPAHDALVSEATVRGELATLGRLYQIRLAAAPHDLVAQRGRNEVLRLASLVPSAAVEQGPARRWPRVLLGAFFLAWTVMMVSWAIALFGGEQ